MLDPQGTNEIVELIKRLNKERNKTVITITHDLAFAGLSDRLFVLKQGELILQGIPQDVFKEVDLLKSSNLEVPQALSVYNHFKNKKAPKALLEALWEFNSKM
jgi:energy-coupling factor transport system ATP-binding protein